MIKNISNLGDAALYCDFGNEVNKEISRSDIMREMNKGNQLSYNNSNNIPEPFNII